jgi:mRNA interferase MazF
VGRIKQYNVYRVELDPVQGSEIAKTRPCVVVAGKAGELAVDQIRTVDKMRLNTNKTLGCLSMNEIILLQNTINEMFCL